MPPRNDGLERWRGAVDEKLKNLDEKLDAIPGVIETLGDRFVAALKTHNDDDHEKFGDLNTRVSTLEKAYAKLAVKVAGVSAVATAVVGYAVKKLLG